VDLPGPRGWGGVVVVVVPLDMRGFSLSLLRARELDRLHSIIHHNDVDGNGSLDWDEFLAIMRRGVIDPDEKYIFDLFFDNSER